MKNKLSPLLVIITPDEIEWAFSREADHLWQYKGDDDLGPLAPYDAIIMRKSQMIQPTLVKSFPGRLNEEQASTLGGIVYSSMLGMLKIIAMVLERRGESS